MAGTPRGRFGWDELFTSDPGAAEGYDRTVMGWTTELWEGGEIPYTTWKVGDRPIGGMMKLPPQAVDAGAPPHWISYVTTPDAGATVARARELGGTAAVGPEDVPGGGRIAQCMDPQGAAFALHYGPDA